MSFLPVDVPERVALDGAFQHSFLVHIHSRRLLGDDFGRHCNHKIEMTHSENAGAKPSDGTLAFHMEIEP